MTETSLTWAAVATLVVTPILGRLAGWMTRRALAVRPGQISNTMASLPARGDARGEPAARFERSVRRCEGLVLRAMATRQGPFESLSLASELA